MTCSTPSMLGYGGGTQNCFECGVLIGPDDPCWGPVDGPDPGLWYDLCPDCFAAFEVHRHDVPGEMRVAELCSMYGNIGRRRFGLPLRGKGHHEDAARA